MSTPKKRAKVETATMSDVIDKIVGSLDSTSSVVVVIGDRDKNTFEIISNDEEEEYVSSVLDAASEHVKSSADPTSYLHKIKH